MVVRIFPFRRSCVRTVFFLYLIDPDISFSFPVTLRGPPFPAYVFGDPAFFLSCHHVGAHRAPPAPSQPRVLLGLITFLSFPHEHGSARSRFLVRVPSGSFPLN